MSSLIHTRFQPGEWSNKMAINRFNGLPFSRESETVETVRKPKEPSVTRLKPGENEREPVFDDRA